MRPGQHAEIGATGGKNRVHVLVRRDIADRHRRDADFVPDAIGKGRLKLPAVLRFGVGHGLTGRDVGDVAIVTLKQPGDLDRIGRLHPTRCPVDCRDAHRHRLVVGPHRAHGIEDLERKSHTVFE